MADIDKTKYAYNKQFKDRWEIEIDEHDPNLNAKKVNIMSGFNIPTYDDIELNYTGEDLTSVIYKFETVIVATLTLTYTSGKLTKVGHT